MSSSEIVTIISALSVAVVAIIGAWRTGAKVQEAADNTQRTAGIVGKKLDAIHTLTNSNLTSVKVDLAIANDRIVKLESLIKELIEAPLDEKNEVKAAEETIKKSVKRRVNET